MAAPKDNDRSKPQMNARAGKAGPRKNVPAVAMIQGHGGPAAAKPKQ